MMGATGWERPPPLVVAQRHNGGVRVHLVDGTYELFRHHFGLPEEIRVGPDAAVRSVVEGMVSLLEDGVTHIGVATDHVVESFRNELWPDYKSSAGMDPAILEQFGPLEEALGELGVVVWAMTDLEADDALASASTVAAEEDEVEQVCILTADKDLAQMVRGTRVVQVDRRRQRVIDHDGVVEKFGVEPESIPDLLALVGDQADGFPGLPGLGDEVGGHRLGALSPHRRHPGRRGELGRRSSGRTSPRGDVEAEP